MAVVNGVSLLENLFKKSPARRIALGFAIAAVFLFLAGTLSHYDIFSAFDLTIRNNVIPLQSQWLTDLMVFVTRLGSTTGLFILGSVVVLGLIVFRQWKIAELFLLAMIGQAILHHGFKMIFSIARPESLIPYAIDDSASFPSGHAVAATAFYGFLALVAAQRTTSKTLRIFVLGLAAVLILLICFSRIYIGVHRPSDVIAGFIAAAIWILAVIPQSHGPVTIQTQNPSL